MLDVPPEALWAVAVGLLFCVAAWLLLLWLKPSESKMMYDGLSYDTSGAPEGAWLVRHETTDTEESS